jgi:hypothetical protein
MAQGQNNFWLAVIVGFIVMLVLTILPVISPLDGGFVAGLIARGGAMSGEKAGLLAVLLGVIIIAIAMLAGLTIFAGAVGFLIAVAGSLVVLLVFRIHAILGFAVGAIGGALWSRYGKPSKNRGM